MFASVVSLYGLIITALLFFAGCNDANFAGGVANKPKVPSSGDGSGKKPTGPDGKPSGWDDGVGISDPNDPTNGIEGGIDGGSGTAATSFVPLKVFYDGHNAGDDSQFTYFIQRTSPIAEKNMREIVKSAKSTTREGSLANVCACGQRTVLKLYWHHISDSQWAKGSLHGNTNGEWMVAKTAPSDWKSKLNPKTENSYTVFMGADLENPAFIANPIGLGYFRTVTFHPNSPFDSSRTWDTRDDMRFVYHCAVDQCPPEKRSATVLDFDHHSSMGP